MDESVSDIRRRAWVTRRAKYGERGHNGSYLRSGGPECPHCARMIDAIVRFHVLGDLSEGQAAKATGLYRIDLRERADAIINGDEHD